MYPYLDQLLHRLLARHHFWRHVDFSEIAELYASRVLRTAGVSMVSIFVAVYLYQLGYDVLFIMLFFAAYFLVRGLSSIPAAYLTAQIGPKHATFISNLMYLPALLALAFLPEYGFPLLVVYGLFQGFSMSLYNISYNVDFSKIKHNDHAGKEIGFMQIMDRVGMMLSPLIGGIVAFLFDPKVTIIAAMVIFGLAALPLFFSPEPVKVHQKIQLGAALRKYRLRHFLTYVGVGSNQAASVFIWPLFLVVAVFTSGSAVVYAQIGAVTSLAVLAGVVAARIYGVLIDRARGKELLKLTATGISLLHLSRLAVTSPVGVVVFNIIYEAVTTGYVMSFLKGMLDAADDDGYRISYLAIAELVFGIGAVALVLFGALTVWFFGGVRGIQVQYVFAALLSLLILKQQFKIYSK